MLRHCTVKIKLSRAAADIRRLRKVPDGNGIGRSYRPPQSRGLLVLRKLVCDLGVFGVAADVVARATGMAESGSADTRHLSGNRSRVAIALRRDVENDVVSAIGIRRHTTGNVVQSQSI